MPQYDFSVQYVLNGFVIVLTLNPINALFLSFTHNPIQKIFMGFLVLQS